MLEILHSIAAQDVVVPATTALSKAIETGGLATGCALFVFISFMLYRGKEKQTVDHAAELKQLNAAYSLSLQTLAEKSRTNEEAKNERIIGLTSKLTEVVTVNLGAMTELKEIVEKWDRRQPKPPR